MEEPNQAQLLRLLKVALQGYSYNSPLVNIYKEAKLLGCDKAVLEMLLSNASENSSSLIRLIEENLLSVDEVVGIMEDKRMAPYLKIVIRTALKGSAPYNKILWEKVVSLMGNSQNRDLGWFIGEELWRYLGEGVPISFLAQYFKACEQHGWDEFPLKTKTDLIRMLFARAEFKEWLRNNHVNFLTLNDSVKSQEMAVYAFVNKQAKGHAALGLE